MTTQHIYHTPVMLHECLAYLNIQKNGVYVDATFGGGGHSRAILEHLSEKGKLFAFDQDKEAERNLVNDERLVFVNSNFRNLKRFLQYYQIVEVDGILADLGVSLHQFQEGGRGFSYRYNALLDMRMNTSQEVSAKDIVNTYSEEQLSKLFYEYSDLKNSKRIAYLIVKYRMQKSIETTFDLIEAISPALPKVNDYPILSKIFQAIRIEVNKEVEVLKDFLNQSYQMLKKGGRLVVLTYHSIEDRMVKQFMKGTGTNEAIEPDPIYGTQSFPFKILTKKALIPTTAEIDKNPQARSAKLRAAEKLF